MPVPKYHQLMLPLLRYVSDKEEHTTQEIMNFLVSNFQLTEEEQNQQMPNRARNLLYDRLNWAKVYLRKAKLIESVNRATIIITERGQLVAQDTITELTIKYLKKFPEFAEFISGNSDNTEIKGKKSEVLVIDITPEEAIDNQYGRLIKSLSDDLLENIKTCSPSFFEGLVVDLLVKMGYGGSQKEAGQVVGKSGDGGIDGLIKEDRLGLDVVYIQAKRWEGNVGSKELQSFVGALAGRKAKKGVFITTSSFTKSALEFVDSIDYKVVLIDGRLLAQLMIEFGLGVSLEKIYEIKQIDQDYFEVK